MTARRLAFAALLATVASTTVAVPASADDLDLDPTPASPRYVVSLDAPDSGLMLRQASFATQLAPAPQDPDNPAEAGSLEGVAVELQQLIEPKRSGARGTWTTVASGVTGADGTWRARHILGIDASQSFRVAATGADPDGDGPETAPVDYSDPAKVTALTHRTRLTAEGATRIVDERTATISWRLLTADDRPVPGAKVSLERVALTARARTEKGVRRAVDTLVTDEKGRIHLQVDPRFDTRWFASATQGPWWRASKAKPRTLDNVAPGSPVSLPSGAPSPRVRTELQPFAVGDDANPVVRSIPDSIWGEMAGIAWRPGCPVGRSGLRMVEVNYWGFDGYRYRGQIIVNASVASRVASAFADLYRQQLPIRSMILVHRFGYSAKLNGADDYRSMAADNTSGFNCREVVGRPGVTSPHAYGRSVDINPWENPYLSGTDGWVPNTWWVGKSHPRVAWRSGSHPVVATMRRHGIAWTYGTRDAHHFDA